VLVHALSAVLPADFPATGVRLSDALPFEGDRLYLPTPAGRTAESAWTRTSAPMATEARRGSCVHRRQGL
ncbi:MAG: hypothetical protein ACLT3C_07355, partial [Peptococcus niger]